MNLECRTRPGPRLPRPARASHSQVRNRGAELRFRTKGTLPLASPPRFPPPFSPRPTQPPRAQSPPPTLLAVGVCNGSQMGLEETEGVGLLEAVLRGGLSRRLIPSLLIAFHHSVLRCLITYDLREGSRLFLALPPNRPSNKTWASENRVPRLRKALYPHPCKPRRA